MRGSTMKPSSSAAPGRIGERFGSVCGTNDLVRVDPFCRMPLRKGVEAARRVPGKLREGLCVTFWSASSRDHPPKRLPTKHGSELDVDSVGSTNFFLRQICT